MRLCALMACFNRRALTLASLAALQESSSRVGVALQAVLVDDGSSDGTAEAVRARFPWVQVHVNQGPPLFWCRAMHRALESARAAEHDLYLLLNDDTLLDPDAIERLLSCSAALQAAHRAALVVGSTRDAMTGRWSYGGERRLSQWRPVRFTPVEPAGEPKKADTFDGNIVLLPRLVVQTLGNLDPYFEHGLGDTDYGLRATKAGIGVWVAPGFYGTCSWNSMEKTYLDPQWPSALRWKHMLSRKGLPWRSWQHFTRRHASLLWPVYFASPYARVLWSMASQWLRGNASRRAR